MLLIFFHETAPSSRAINPARTRVLRVQVGPEILLKNIGSRPVDQLSFCDMPEQEFS